MYPNPTIDQVNFTIQDDEKYRYVISDALGKQLLLGTFHNTETVNMRDLPSGVYLVKLQQLSTGDQTTIKLLKQ